MGMSTSNKPTINITPLIDVLLVLLIIFVVWAPKRVAKIETQIPAKPNSPTPQPPNTDLLMVVVSPDRTIALNSSPMSLEVLGATLTRELEHRENRTVIVKAPRNLDYSGLMVVVDTLKA